MRLDPEVECQSPVEPEAEVGSEVTFEVEVEGEAEVGVKAVPDVENQVSSDLYLLVIKFRRLVCFLSKPFLPT